MRFPYRSVPVLLAFTLVLTGCPGDSTGPDEMATTATLTHESGFDFSAGAPDPAFTNNDGDVITWQPGPSQPTHPSYPNFDNVWWRNDLTTDDGSNATVDMGAVDLSSVTSVPSTFEAAPNITPLLVGHVYVAKCHDGYVKFKVTATDTESWTATVEYVYTTGTTF